jgi:hypothetical protein
MESTPQEKFARAWSVPAPAAVGLADRRGLHSLLALLALWRSMTA